MSGKKYNFKLQVVMEHISFVIFILAFSVNVSFSQVDSKASRNPSQTISLHKKSDLESVRIGLLARSYILKLKTHPKIDLNKEEYDTYMMIMDSLQGKDYREIDSMTITLKSGLSWKLGGPLPQQPKNLLFKMLTKKGRQRKEVQEYIQFSNFVEAWKEQDNIPYEMVEKLSRYYAVVFEDSKCIEMLYEFKYTSINSTEITKRKVTFDKHFYEK